MTAPQTDAQNNNKKNKRPWWKRGLKILWRTFLVIFILLVALILFVRSPWGQEIIVNKATSYISDKTNTEVSIGELYITFGGDIEIRDVYLEDKQQDTLIYSEELLAEIPIWPIITGGPISIDGLKWSGVTANISRQDSIQGFNFQFLVDALSSKKSNPKKSTGPPEIEIGTIELNDIHLVYTDDVVGTDMVVNLGNLSAEGKTFDIEKFIFKVEEIALKNTDVSYVQYKPFVTTGEVPMPIMGADDILIENVHYTMDFQPEKLKTDIAIGKLETQVPNADLKNQNILVENFKLKNLDGEVLLAELPKSQTDSTALTKETIFIWPDWNVEVKALDLLDNNLAYHVGEVNSASENFDPNHIVLTDFFLSAEDIQLSEDEEANIYLKDISFNQVNGIDLDTLTFDINVTPTKTVVQDLIVQADGNFVNTDVIVNYDSIQQVVANPEELSGAIDLQSFELDLDDAYYFNPALKENEQFNALAENNISGSLEAEGNASEIYLSHLNVKWGAETNVYGNGYAKNIQDIDNLYASIDDLTLETTNNAISNFIPVEELGISIPESIELETQFNGSINDASGIAIITTSEGKVTVDGSFTQEDKLAFDAAVNIQDLNLGKILKNKDLGEVSGKIVTKGSGTTLNTLNADLNSKFTELELNGYDYSALKLKGDLRRGKGDLDIKYKDENLNLVVDSWINLDTIAPEIEMDFDMKGADFQAMNLMEKDMKGRLMMEAYFKGNMQVFEFNTHIAEGVAVYNGGNHYLGAMDISAEAFSDSLAVDINSQFLTGLLRGNAGIDSTITAIEHHLAHYLNDSIENVDTITNPVDLRLELELIEHDLVTDFLLPDLKTMQPLNITVDFHQKSQELIANINLPYANYAGTKLDSFQLDIKSTAQDADFYLEFNEIDATPLLISHTSLDGAYHNKELKMKFNTTKGNEDLYTVNSVISGEIGDLKIHVEPKDLIINKKEWNIPEDNIINITDESITASNFKLTRESRSVKLDDGLGTTEKPNFGVAFNNFRLANFLAFLNTEEPMAEGELQGYVAVVDPYDNIGLKANLKIDSLKVMQAPMGTLTLDAQPTAGDEYYLDLEVHGPDVDMITKGEYTLDSVGNELELNMDLERIGMKTIAALSNDELQNASGYLTGNVDISGNINNPNYQGYVKFKDAVFNVSQLNSQFKLKDDKIKVDNDDIILNKFSIQDANNQDLVIDGKINTADMFNPELDLTVNSKNFRAMNSTKKDNDVFYGVVNFDISGELTGTLNSPDADLTLTVNENTDFTYVVQDIQAQIEKREGIIEFVNKENPDNILTRKDDSTAMVAFGAIELDARLNIHEDAKINIIVNPRTGDKLSVSGKGELDFNIAENGDMTLSGRYEIYDGKYSLSLYNLVSREFEFEKGSSIVWHGASPLEADLNVTAKYRVETSASNLMASRVSGSSEQVQNKYQQQLPFLVFLNVGGELEKPELDFRLGMPESSQGAIDGSVYGRVKQLNSEQDDLNRQVFSLLVLQKFYPNSGSDGSAGGGATLVRSNINDAIADQLNAFSGKLTGKTGIELSFGLDSYTNYQGETAQQQTDLNISAEKKLLDDRLIVQVGSDVNVQGDAAQNQNAVVGDVSIVYILTEDGHWRIKGFRNNEFENEIDGQVIVNGLALIFQKEFNKFNELFKAANKDAIKDENEEEEKSEKDESKDLSENTKNDSINE